MTESVVIYTDGACDPNPGPGGWAAILRYGRHERVISGGNPQTTNNRMELQAALSALQALKRPCRIVLHTDSQYLRRGITQWLPAWQSRGWRTNNRSVVRNQDLWKALANELERHQVEWHWVPGHSGHPLNERADRLARTAIPRPRSPKSGSQIDLAPAAKEVHLFTRASSLGKAGPGGWAVVARRGNELFSRSGSAPVSTANEMELQAAIEGLANLPKPSHVHLYTVSKYLHQGVTSWAKGWQARDWKTREGKPVRHKTLWLALQDALAPHQVEWHLLPADDRPAESDQAATLAAQAARTAQEKSTSNAAKD